VGGGPAASQRAWAPVHRRAVPRTPDRRRVPVALPPGPEPSNPPPTRLAQFTWLATKGTAWVVRRSTDLVPSLVMMAIREGWPPQETPGEAPSPLATPQTLA